MKNTKVEIPEIPWELVDEARRVTRLACERRDLNLKEPAISLSWDRPNQQIDGKSSMSGAILGNPKRMIEDPSYDLHWQLTWVRRQVEHLSAGRELGVPVANHLGLHLLHFGTGPLTTAFGARMILRGQGPAVL